MLLPGAAAGGFGGGAASSVLLPGAAAAFFVVFALARCSFRFQPFCGHSLALRQDQLPPKLEISERLDIAAKLGSSPSSTSDRIADGFTDVNECKCLQDKLS